MKKLVKKKRKKEVNEEFINVRNITLRSYIISYRSTTKSAKTSYMVGSFTEI